MYIYTQCRVCFKLIEVYLFDETFWHRLIQELYTTFNFRLKMLCVCFGHTGKRKLEYLNLQLYF